MCSDVEKRDAENWRVLLCNSLYEGSVIDRGHICTLYLHNFFHCIMGYCIIKGSSLIMNAYDEKNV